MKKILEILLLPIQALGKHAASDRIINFFDKRPYMVYIFASLITIAYVFFKYIYPVLS